MTFSTTCFAVQKILQSSLISTKYYNDSRPDNNFILNINAINVSWSLLSKVLNITVLIDFKALSGRKESASGQCAYTLSVLSLNALKQWNTDALQSCKSAASLMQLWERDAASQVSSKKELSLSSTDALQGVMQSLQTYPSAFVSKLSIKRSENLNSNAFLHI